MQKKKIAGARRSATPKNTKPSVQKTVVWFVAAIAVVFQLASCGEKLPSLPALPSFSKQEASPAPRQQLSGVQTSFTDCKHFFAAGVPPVVPQAPMLRELCYDSFAILHSGATKTPVFVAQKLNRASVADADEKRTDRFFADARLPRAERAELSDYRGSGYSKGHMAPAGDMPNPTAMSQSFSLANMIPQVQSHNGGAWKKIETDTRLYAGRAIGDVYVITGPVFSHYVKPVGAGQVAVPTHLFKLVYDAETKRAWAHWQENAKGVRAGEPISYGELTQRMGMELLPGAEVR